MNDLPPELWTIIFKRLIFVDQSNCRLVSARWRNIVDSIQVDDLMVVCDQITCYGQTDRWFLSDETILPTNRLAYNLQLSPESFRLPWRVHANVRRLKLNTVIRCNRLNLVWLEQFERLKQLEIYKVILLERVSSISLPILDALYIEVILGETLVDDGRFDLNAPRLQFAYFGQGVLEAVRLSYADRLQYLEFKCIGDQASLDQFETLKIVHCHSTREIGLELMSKLIGGLRELTELHLYARSNNRQSLRALFEHFSSETAKLGKLNLKLYFGGVWMRSARDLDELFD